MCSISAHLCANALQNEAFFVRDSGNGDRKMNLNGCADGPFRFDRDRACVHTCWQDRGQGPQVLPAYGLQDLWNEQQEPKTRSNPNTMCLQITLGENHGTGHFYRAENRTFLLCVDRPRPRPMLFCAASSSKPLPWSLILRKISLGSPVNSASTTLDPLCLAVLRKHSWKMRNKHSEIPRSRCRGTPCSFWKWSQDRHSYGRDTYDLTATLFTVAG